MGRVRARACAGVCAIPLKRREGGGGQRDVGQTRICSCHFFTQQPLAAAACHATRQRSGFGTAMTSLQGHAQRERGKAHTKCDQGHPETARE